jgi:O-succinylbenzoate synthase
MKRQIDWNEVKARYCMGERTPTICNDFLGLTPTMISSRAYRWNWKKAKKEAENHVEDVVKNRLEGMAERVLSELEAIAFSNLSDVCEWDDSGVTLKDSGTLEPEALSAVQEVSVKPGMLGSEKKIKMLDKMKALDMLAKIAGLTKDEKQDIQEAFELVIRSQKQINTEPEDDAQA